MAQVTVACPQCNARSEADERRLGREAVCSDCGMPYLLLEARLLFDEEQEAASPFGDVALLGEAVAESHEPDELPVEVTDWRRGLTASILCALLFYSTLIASLAAAGKAAEAGPALRIVAAAAELLCLLIIPLVMFAGRTTERLGCGSLRARYAMPALVLGLASIIAINQLAAYISATLGPSRYAEELASRFLSVEGPAGWVSAILFFAVIPGVCEELFFRGLVLRTLKVRLPFWKSAVISSMAFALFHMDPVMLVPLFLMGLVLAIIAQRTGTVWYGVLIHIAANAWAVLLYNQSNPAASDGDMISLPVFFIALYALIGGLCALWRTKGSAPKAGSGDLSASVPKERASLFCWASAVFAAATVAVFASALLDRSLLGRDVHAQADLFKRHAVRQDGRLRAWKGPMRSNGQRVLNGSPRHWTSPVALDGERAAILAEVLQDDRKDVRHAAMTACLEDFHTGQGVELKVYAQVLAAALTDARDSNAKLQRAAERLLYRLMSGISSDEHFDGFFSAGGGEWLAGLFARKDDADWDGIEIFLDIAAKQANADQMDFIMKHGGLEWFEEAFVAGSRQEFHPALRFIDSLMVNGDDSRRADCLRAVLAKLSPPARMVLPAHLRERHAPESMQDGRTRAALANRLAHAALANRLAHTDGTAKHAAEFDYVEADMDEAGIIYFLDTAGNFVRRYDSITARFIPSLVADSGLRSFAVASEGGHVYVGYDGGRMDVIDTATGERTALAAAPDTVVLMVVIDGYIFTAQDRGGTTQSLYSRATGLLVHTSNREDYWSRGVAYAPSLSRIFSIGVGLSPDNIFSTDIDLENGALGSDVDSPYDGDYKFSPPMRLFPDETKIAMSSGHLFDTEDLTHAGNIGMGYKDLRFLGEKVYLINEAGDQTELTLMDMNFNSLDRMEFEGKPRNLFITADSLHLVTESSAGSVSIRSLRESELQSHGVAVRDGAKELVTEVAQDAEPTEASGTERAPTDDNCPGTNGDLSWSKHEANPVLDVGPPGSWDDVHTGPGAVILEGSQFRMWYSGYDGSKVRIGYATSTDGINWAKHSDNPVLDVGGAGAWDETNVAEPSVLFDGVTYHMWYKGRRSVNQIGYATSSDGLNWTKHPGNPVLTASSSGWESGTVYAPSVVFDGTTYHMWYIGGAHIGYATSSDAINWTKHAGNPVLSAGPSGGWNGSSVGYPFVLLDDGIFKMWYVGQSPEPQIGFATSPDGVNWTKSPDNPVVGFGADGTWDDDGVGDPAVVRVVDTYHMWYAGDSPSEIRVGYATAACVPGTGGCGGADPSTIIYVDAGAQGSDTGLNWTDAFVDLQSALTIAPSGSEVWVAAGTYLPSHSGDREATFQLVSGVALYGGFPPGGGDGTCVVRDPHQFQTVLSGELNGDGAHSGNSLHVVTASETDSTARLDGFTIEAGNADGRNGTDACWGGGVYNWHGSPTIVDSVIRDNRAKQGAGMSNENAAGSDSTPTLINCRFVDNTASGHGAGAYNQHCSPTFINCLFHNNASGDDGGGIAFQGTGFSTLFNCTVVGNTAQSEGGGVYYWNDNDSSLANSIIWGNSASVSGNQIHKSSSNTVSVSYSCVEGGYGGPGNIADDPLFADADLHLLVGSLCVNGGYNAVVPSDVETDLDGNSRIIDGIVDMGALEHAAGQPSRD